MKLGGSITLSENDKVGMMEEAQHIVQEMRGTGCTDQRDNAVSEQEKAHKCEKLSVHLLVGLWQFIFGSWTKRYKSESHCCLAPHSEEM